MELKGDLLIEEVGSDAGSSSGLLGERIGCQTIDSPGAEGGGWLQDGRVIVFR